MDRRAIAFVIDRYSARRVRGIKRRPAIVVLACTGIQRKPFADYFRDFSHIWPHHRVGYYLH